MKKKRKLVIDSMILSSVAHPVQLDGILMNKKHFEFNYRRGYLSIMVCHEQIVGEQIGGEFDSFLEDTKIVELLKKYGFTFTDETTFKEVFG